ncbi:MAG: ABC transporter permease subunit [Termitinemataceae bacterium]|nr:MAG: ABC transporter permease subunit [Termitinemataceae bacterium]
MSDIKKTKWFDAPRIVHDSVHWKPKSEIWVWAAAFSYILALGENYLLANIDAKVYPTPYRTVLCLGFAALLVMYLAGLKNINFRKKLYHKAQFVFASGITLLIWDVLTAKTRILPMPFFPSIQEIIAVMWDDRKLLWISTIYSMRLFFVGFVTGTVLGLMTGTLVGWRRQWDYWLSPVIRISGIIPAVAWLPIALVVLPTSFATGVFLIFISSWFPVSSMMASGIIATPRSYFEAAKTLGADNKFLLFRIAIPNAMPSMFVGILTATAFSFTTLIVSEMVGAPAGLGYYINWAKGWGAYSKVYGAIIIIAIEFSIILALLGAIKSRTLQWQRGILK